LQVVIENLRRCFQGSPTKQFTALPDLIRPLKERNESFRQRYRSPRLPSCAVGLRVLGPTAELKMVLVCLFHTSRRSPSFRCLLVACEFHIVRTTRNSALPLSIRA